MSEWQNVTLKQLVKFGNGKSRPKEKGDIPVYGGNGILDFTDKYNYDGKTLIIGRVGAYCGATYLEKNPIWVSDNALSVKALDNNCPEYLYYLFKYLDLNQYAQGSSHPLLTQTLLNAIEVDTTLDNSEQKAIASVLSSLDDKIDLLHRQNKTLEAMAETLFRQWFVEEAQGEWGEYNVLDLFSLVGGGTPKTSIEEYWNGSIPWVSGGDIAQSHKGFLSKTEKNITELGFNNSSTKLLPKLSTIISARGTVGKYALLNHDMCFSQSNYGIIPKNHNCYYFVYLLVGFIVDELLVAAYGSVFDTITTRTFEAVNLKLPKMSKITDFELTVCGYFIKKELNTKQIQTLQKLRDTLLPKLISGEVRVKYTPEHVDQ